VDQLKVVLYIIHVDATENHVIDEIYF